MFTLFAVLDCHGKLRYQMTRWIRILQLPSFRLTLGAISAIYWASLISNLWICAIINWGWWKAIGCCCFAHCSAALDFNFAYQSVLTEGRSSSEGLIFIGFKRKSIRYFPRRCFPRIKPTKKSAVPWGVFQSLTQDIMVRWLKIDTRGAVSKMIWLLSLGQWYTQRIASDRNGPWGLFCYVAICGPWAIKGDPLWPHLVSESLWM